MAKHAWKVLLAGIVVVLGLLVLQGTGEQQPAAPPAAPPPAAPPKIETRKTIGKTTQNVLSLSEAKAQGGVVIDNDAEPEEGGLGAYAQATRHTMARIGGLAVQQKMQHYQAEHGSLPATHQEFMAKIIAPGAPDEVRLPMLPYYQEYAFDPAAKGIVVVEFPEKKAQRERETSGAAGP